MSTLYSMVNETGNRNRILEMCKFRIWIRLGITFTILHRFSPNFACGSEMWSLWRLLFVGQTGSGLPILEVCGFRFWQFSGSGDYICQQISTKSHVQIKFSNADFVFNGDWNWKYKSDFRDVRIPDLVSIIYYVHNSLPIFVKYCKRLRNVVASTPICDTNRKQFADFGSVRILIWQFSGSGDHTFQQISIRSHVQIKFGNADFVFDGE